MEQYLINTNIVSKYLEGTLSDSIRKFLDGVINATPCISVITEIELLSWKASPETEALVISFIRDSVVLPVDSHVVKECARIRRSLSKQIKTPDAIIAATAIASNRTLLTGNEKDFRIIHQLKLKNIQGGQEGSLRAG